ncbi:hypothetical protein FE257_005336 [Aspergillus nanangensis]|uniref:Mitochondrial division protein 1 n=1 Tax=Aspergillus nanangensis TaxID=2582783 RepID=A0AAD4GMS8_ASPNN|nr:hypothetical protein FE257_005336 [Aspergillus nanangensis]
MLNQTQSLNVLINQKIDLRWLLIAKGAVFNDSNQQIQYLPGTQVELLHNIDQWVKTPNDKWLFWLSGVAETEKSTIARTVSSRFKEQGILGASFFFRRGEQERGNAKLLFSTLAKQLGDTIPQLTPNIQHAIRNDPEISARELEEQFQKLILEPLDALNPARSTSTILIVIDALDEYSQDDDIHDILGLLPHLQESCSMQFRFLLTSRPDLPMKLGLQGATDDHQHLIIHEIPNSVMEHDIKLYLNYKLLWMQQERGLPADWPGDKTINTLVKRTIPSFISTTTLFRFEQFELFYSVLDVPARSDEPVQILHLSFQDFLLDKEQKEYLFWIDESLVHKKLATQYLKVMQDPKYGLQKNICNLQNKITPKFNIDKDTLSHCLPSELEFNDQENIRNLFDIVAFSPDGQLLAFSSDDHTVKLWDHRTGELLQTLKGHSDWVGSINFSPDSQLLASASFDDSIKVWDTRTGELCHTFWGGVDGIYSVTFVSDDRLSGSSENNTVKIWDLYTGELREVYGLTAAE